MRRHLTITCSIAALAVAAWTGTASAQEASPQASPAPTQVDAGTAASPAQVSPAVTTPANGTPQASGEDSQLGDVIVTAQRRAESVQTTPLAIDVVSPNSLARQGITNTADLSKVVPALQNSKAGGPFLLFFLRGVGSTASNSLTDAAVEVSLDDVPLARQYSANGQFYDLQRVEVLKGPQGTLYGRNATGGVINLIPQHPEFENSIDLGLTAGNYGTIQVNGAVNAKISDSSAARLSFQRIKHDGYLTDGEGDEDSIAVRGQLRVDPTSDLSLLLSGDYVHLGGEGSGYAVQNLGFTVADRVGVADPRVQAYYTQTAHLPVLASQLFNNNSFYGVRASATWSSSLGELTIIPAYRHADIRYVATNGAVLIDNETDDQSSVEGRFAFNAIGPLKPTVGAYYLDDVVHSVYTVNNLNTNQTLPAAGNTQNFRQGTRAYAIFADTTFALTSTLRLIGGVRYTSEDKTIGGTLTTFATFVPVLPINADKTFHSTDYRGGAEWNVAPNSLIYGSVSSGFHSGGFFFTHDNPAYQPERLTAYTIGTKNEFFGRRLLINLELFDWKYTNQQLSGVSTDSSGSTVFATVNAAKSTVKGFEFKTQFKLSRDTLIGGDVQYLNAKFDSFSHIVPFPSGAGFACLQTRVAAGFNQDCSGQTLPQSPSWTINLAAEQTFHLGEIGTLVLDAGGHHQTSSYTSINYLPPNVQGDYWTGDVSLTYSPDKALSISGFVNNLSNVIVKASSLDQIVDGALIRPPRTYGVRFAVHF